jgi:tRNA (cmo5U34)-methyltransferase
MTNFFNHEASQSYDAKNARLAPIGDAMHFLIRLILQELPAKARVLCVGVGTGAEILSLAQHYPEWRFVGVDPSAAMLDMCHKRLEAAGISNRCELIHGYVQDAPDGANFDAVLSILVGHFVKREERLSFYQNMQQRLKPSGYFINTEISYDLDAETFPTMLEHWGKVQQLMGATEESLAALPNALRNILCVLSPDETEALIRASGIAHPTRFFQALMITGWYGRK